MADLTTCTIISYFDTYLTADASGAVSLEKERSNEANWKIEKVDEYYYRIINAKYETYLRFNFLNIVDTTSKTDTNTLWRIRRDQNHCFIQAYDNR